MYFVRYVGPGGIERKLKIGSPATMDLDEARRQARKALAIVDAGGDPSANKAVRREAWTVAQAAEAYIASAEFARHTVKVQSNNKAMLRHHIVHHLGTVTLATLDVPRVRRMLRAIEADTRTNKRKRRLGGAGASRKAARVLSALLSWCVHEGRLARNPLIGSLRLVGDNVRETVITETKQFAALFEAMDALVSEGMLRPAARTFIVLAALTALRRGELQALRWGAIDLAHHHQGRQARTQRHQDGA